MNDKRPSKHSSFGDYRRADWFQKELEAHEAQATANVNKLVAERDAMAARIVVTEATVREREVRIMELGALNEALAKANESLALRASPLDFQVAELAARVVERDLRIAAMWKVLARSDALFEAANAAVSAVIFKGKP